jgi:saccharopine dehydrogenase (NAD+, L-glutamate forming)
LTEHLASLGPAGRDVTAVTVDISDVRAVRALADSTAVVASTVGPFEQYGEPLVGACADTGTDYLDITGEPEFVDRMWLRHHARAESTGARLVHCCGFDSVPHDLGAWFTVHQLPADEPLSVRGYVRGHGGLSTGTYHSAVRALSRLRQSSAVAASRRRTEPPSVAAHRRVRALSQRPHRSPDGRGWALPLPTIDPVVVRRSARAMTRYGPDFGYGHYAVVPSAVTAVAAPVALGAVTAVAQVPQGRDALLRLRSAGAGPSAQKRARSWFSVRFVGSGGGRRVVTEVRGGDPGYGGTATMLAEAALCLALDDTPSTAGQVTTAQAMGDRLLSRLQTAGITFTTESSDPRIP